MGGRCHSRKCAQLVCYPGIHEWTKDAMAITEKQEELRSRFAKPTWYEESWELRELIREERVNGGWSEENVKKKLARSSLTRAGHAERMGEEKLAKRADAQKVKRKRGERGPKLRWRVA